MFEMGLLGLCAHEQVGASPWIGSEGSLPQLYSKRTPLVSRAPAQTLLPSC